jgi:ribosome-associated protein
VTTYDLAKRAAAAVKDKKGSKIVLMDLKGVSDFCEIQLVCSGENDRQTKAIAEAIEAGCRETFGIRPYAVEGKQSGTWVFMDYGALIVHVFQAEVRDYYAIETIWPTAKKLAAE